MGKIAWINLSTGQIEISTTPEEDLQKYLGSRGLAAKVLYDHVGPSKPFDQKIF